MTKPKLPKTAEKKPVEENKPAEETPVDAPAESEASKEETETPSPPDASSEPARSPPEEEASALKEEVPAEDVPPAAEGDPPSAEEKEAPLTEQTPVELAAEPEPQPACSRHCVLCILRCCFMGFGKTNQFLVCLFAYLSPLNFEYCVHFKGLNRVTINYF